MHFFAPLSLVSSMAADPGRLILKALKQHQTTGMIASAHADNPSEQPILDEIVLLTGEAEGEVEVAHRLLHPGLSSSFEHALSKHRLLVSRVGHFLAILPQQVTGTGIVSDASRSVDLSAKLEMFRSMRGREERCLRPHLLLALALRSHVFCDPTPTCPSSYCQA
eukprot:485360-Hanusia_phi.AAC.4